MRAVLGIDAAWTARQPSGVALVRERDAAWTCAAVAPGYESFLALARGTPVDWNAPARGSKPDPAALVDAAGRILGEPFHGVVTVDMPLASEPIVRRREADNALSRAFGARGCGVHSPSSLRPGPLGDELRRDFERLGFPLATRLARHDCVIEVYPHIAVMALLAAGYRVPYKLGRARQYWPGAPPEERNANLVRNMGRILEALRGRIEAIALPAPEPRKRHEDALDALVCCWIGMRFLAGAATPYGDAAAAIWVPCLEGDALCGS